ncbi:MAG: A/G-specific adenine glycosylase [Oceanipulchritudo sp.]
MRGDFSEFRETLLEWFDRQKRALPWREDPGLYRTVVSEFMLQQTRVETVLPYFERWIRTFPDFPSLARAREAAVLKQWEGLGYYARARNLHKLARSIVKDGVPGSPEEWRKRPGIGPYTAAAVSSIAQNQPEPVIDGNVIRVLARITNDPRPLQSPAEGYRRYQPLARDLIDPERPGDYNEALMELGATVCRKNRPLCLLCPVQRHCEACRRGSPESLPVIKRKTTTRRTVHRLWLVESDRILLHFHPPDASRLAGMAELPELPEPPDSQPVLTRSRGISSEHIRESIHPLGTRHPLSRKCLRRKDCRWVPLRDLPGITLSAPHRRWIEHLLHISSANFSA